MAFKIDILLIWYAVDFSIGKNHEQTRTLKLKKSTHHKRMPKEHNERESNEVIEITRERDIK